MIFGKLLVILHNLSYVQYRSVIDMTLLAAKQPQFLRFAVPSNVLSGLIGGDKQIIGYDINQPLKSIREQLTDENLFFTIGHPMQLCDGWDLKLVWEYRRLRDDKALLTGAFWTNDKSDSHAGRMPIRRRSKAVMQENVIPKEGEAVIEACLPALQLNQQRNIVFTEGMPIINQIRPIPTPFVDASFCYGPIHFLKKDALSFSSFSYIARFEDYKSYALQTVPIRWILYGKRSLFEQPGCGMGNHMLTLYEQQIQIDFAEKKLSVSAQTGYYVSIYHDSLKYFAKDRLKTVKEDIHQYWANQYQPLCITAVTDMQSCHGSNEMLAQRLFFLERIKHLPLLIYTGGEYESLIQRRSSKTERFPDLKLRFLQREGMTPVSFFHYAKIFLLLSAAENRKEYSHFCWVNPDILPHPIHEMTVPNFSALKDNRIHIAAVNHVLDPSFMIVPRQLLSMLQNEVLYNAQKEESLLKDYSEEKLWQQIYNHNKSYFAVHEMNYKGRLFLTAIDHKQLSKQITF